MCLLTGVLGRLAVLTIYDDSISGNCLKGNRISDHLRLACRRIEAAPHGGGASMRISWG